MSNYTPGPWTITIATIRRNSRIVSMTDRFKAKEIAVIIKSNKANARLIAAAPDMLEALVALLPLTKSWEPLSREVTDTQREILQQAEAAIAKAEGGKSENH